MPKAAVRHDPQGELSHELPAAFQNLQKASSTTTAGGEHSLPLYFKNPRNNCLSNNKDPRLKRERCLNKETMRSAAPAPPTTQVHLPYRDEPLEAKGIGSYDKKPYIRGRGGGPRIPQMANVRMTTHTDGQHYIPTQRWTHGPVAGANIHI